MAAKQHDLVRLLAPANLGDDVLYSGTVAAAMEGRFLGIPSIAVSLVLAYPSLRVTSPERWGPSPSAAIAARLARWLIECGGRGTPNP